MSGYREEVGFWVVETYGVQIEVRAAVRGLDGEPGRLCFNPNEVEAVTAAMLRARESLPEEYRDLGE